MTIEYTNTSANGTLKFVPVDPATMFAVADESPIPTDSWDRAWAEVVPPLPPDEGPPPAGDWRAAAGAKARIEEEAARRAEEAKARVKAKVGSAKAGRAEDGSLDYKAMSPSDLGMRRGLAVRKRRQAWLWTHRIAEGALNFIVGQGGLGKSQVAYYLAARITTGSHFPDDAPAAVGDVLILSAEDDPETTIIPRLEACGADLGRIVIMEAAVRIRVEGQESRVHPRSLADLGYWSAVFDNAPEARLIIIDPLPSFLGRGVDDSKNTELRNAIEPFVALCRDRGVTIIAISHLNKAGSGHKSSADRILGSVAYRNLARSVHFVIADPEDKRLRYLKQEKNNLAEGDLPALSFVIETREVPSDDPEDPTPIRTAVPVWQGTAEVDLDGTLAGAQGAVGRPPKVSTALAEWLYDYLSSRPGGEACGAVADAAGAEGLIGERRYIPSRKREGWTGYSTLTAAVDRVASLPAPRAGYKVHTTKRTQGSPAKWVLVPADCPVDHSGNPIPPMPEAPAVTRERAFREAAAAAATPTPPPPPASAPAESAIEQARRIVAERAAKAAPDGPAEAIDGESLVARARDLLADAKAAAVRKQAPAELSIYDRALCMMAARAAESEPIAEPEPPLDLEAAAAKVAAAEASEAAKVDAAAIFAAIREAQVAAPDLEFAPSLGCVAGTVSVRVRRSPDAPWAEVSLVLGASAASTRRAIAEVVGRARKS